MTPDAAAERPDFPIEWLKGLLSHGDLDESLAEIDERLKLLEAQAEQALNEAKADERLEMEGGQALQDEED